MNYNYNGWSIHYKLLGEASRGRPILALHGWGRSIKDFDALSESFPERSFLIVDFPPFGESDKDIEGWNIFTYVSMVISLCEHLEIKSVDLIGHSFGGRIAIILSAIKPTFVHSCILADSAGMKPKRSIKYRLIVLRYKICKKLGKSTVGQGSKDYLALSPEMRKTFVNIVETHLEEYAKKISCPTLIVWGKNDKETPIYMANRLHKLIKQSSLRVIEDGDHFSFLNFPLSFFAIVKQFWENIK